ncbi:MAG TPA: tetratricopeptide repeat protein [Candidatus Angelobacter sp.]|nr:tetratricopeptide repeat protein [Candidatus Angelobacter sp.]
MHSPFCSLLLALIVGLVAASPAQNLRIPLPRKSKYTPVQQLNRDGVSALQKHDIDKAKRLFYKAYLIDPDDPFTLNNLGYVAELEGDLDRAQRYYDQARANTSDAVIDKSTSKQVEGKAVAKVAGDVSGQAVSVNQLNSEAVRLLNDDRAPEADLVLQQAIKIAPNNPFTLNNMGFAKEKQGDLEAAISYYRRSANTGSNDRIVVTANKDWRGKPISEVAAHNARAASDQLAKSNDLENRVARLNLQGVSAINRNDRKTARQDFERAYKLDNQNSFSINNMGYLSELDGDKETAQTYYQQAEKAEHSGAKVAVATRAEVEGHEMRQVAEQSTTLVGSSIEATAEARRRSGERPTLKTRDNRPVKNTPATRNNPGQEKNFTPPEFRSPDQQPNQNDQQQHPELKQRPPH